MAVTKRLRFEILRRDNHQCRYCGAAAPDVPLTVDHVVPVALGGNDDPGNLVAACKDCNAGKSASPADASIVADVGDDALRWAQAIQVAYAERVAQLERTDEFLEEFSTAWYQWTFGTRDDHAPLPSDWERSVAKWYGLGIPMRVLRAAIDRAMPLTRVVRPDKFRYVAGIVWSELTEIQQAARAQMEAPEEPTTSDAEIDAYRNGWQLGYDRCFKENEVAIRNYATQALVSDGHVLAEMGLN